MDSILKFICRKLTILLASHRFGQERVKNIRKVKSIYELLL
jgi:hypothetical protein